MQNKMNGSPGLRFPSQQPVHERFTFAKGKMQDGGTGRPRPGTEDAKRPAGFPTGRFGCFYDMAMCRLAFFKGKRR